MQKRSIKSKLTGLGEATSVAAKHLWTSVQFILRFCRSIVGQFFILIAVAVSLLGAGRLVYDAVAYQIGYVQVGDLTAQLLHRSELAADYAVITLSEFAIMGIGGCDKAGLHEVRKRVYGNGAIKDILALGKDGEVICSGMLEPLGLGLLGVNLQRGFPASNGSIVFHEVGAGQSGLVGISWRFGSRTLLAILNLDLVVFDALPGNLRDRSDAVLSLNDSIAFAQRQSISKANTSKPMKTFLRRSDRYPLAARITVPDELLALHFRPYETEAIATWGIFGLAIGLLLARLVARPPDPRAEMRRALRAGEFMPYMQPIFSLEDSRITGCEVLMRWVKSDGAIVPPVRFIHLAEDSDLIAPMTLAVMATALQELAPLLLARREFTIAFNIVPSHLCAPGFVQEIDALVQGSAARTGQIILELTERQGFEYPALARSVISDLHDMGYVTALDDTGTGHNGLSYVQDLGADIIKIDKKFIDELVTDEGNTHIVELLVGLARRMGMTTVAEGVETAEQAQCLTALGVDKAQGYLMSPPLDPEAFLLFVSARDSLRVVPASRLAMRSAG